MIKSYIIILVCIFATSVTTNAASWVVKVKDDFFENPANFTPKTGDQIVWQWEGTTNQHSVVSTSVPNGASSFTSTVMTTGTYNQTFMVPGTYNYQCGVHGAMMSGSFTITATTGIVEVNASILTEAFPNPFKNGITIKSKNADAIVIYNIQGQLLLTTKIDKGITETQIDLSSLSAGVYFYSVSKDGIIYDTRKIYKVE